MKQQMTLGMYIHMHWGYNYPYAARTWHIEDWQNYMVGLKTLGYSLVQIWPMIDTMPLKLTSSDRAHLKKLQRVIDIAHDLNLTVYVGAAANTLGNEKAANFAFEKRPYFTAERLINPADATEIRDLTTARLQILEPLKAADGFWIIDSDPGGYVSSSPIDFVQLFNVHRQVLDQLRPGIKLLYWMWQGWHGQARFKWEWVQQQQPWWRETLEGIAALAPEPWGILACWKPHFEIIDNLDLTARTLYFPYGAIEGEPNFPWTNYNPERIEAVFSHFPRHLHPLGVLGNAQSHCLQLPHTYLFQQFASGIPANQIDLVGFAENVLPAHGKPLAAAWRALAGEDVDALRDAAARLPDTKSLAGGKLAALCFNDTQRLLNDLNAQLALKIAALDLKQSIRLNQSLREPFDRLKSTIQTWYDFHGFKDWYYGGPFKDLLHPILKSLAAATKSGATIAQALEQFDSGGQHDAFIRLFNFLKTHHLQK
ncbi:hypothetical protein JXJ21_16615 [candidate division KSB1 bacterium]|nr:hypothetical protein [candidate division KSB1 bacterium]